MNHPALPWTRLPLAIAVALALSACSTPQIARWSVPPPATPAAPTNLDAGRAEAAAARQAYQRVVDGYVADQNHVGNGLLGLGLLATVLAASPSVHRDAVLGAGFLAGSVYAYGQFNISKQRALIHHGGVEAVDCAMRAVAPLSMLVSEQQALDALLAQASTRGEALSKAISALRSAQAGAGALDAATSTAVDTVLAAAVAAQDGGRKAQLAGRLLAVKARGASDQLSLAVHKIDNAVVRASLDTQVDLSALPKVISSAAVFAGQIVPGADTFVSDALAKRAKSLGAVSQSGLLKAPGDSKNNAVDTELSRRTRDAQDATDAMLDTTAALQAIVESHASAQAADPLTDCGVTDIAFPLRASVEKLSFTAGTDATRTVILSGGTKPYVVEMADGGDPGLVLKAPPPFESRLIVNAAAAARPGTYTVLVMDSSNPMKTLTLPVDVAAKDDATPVSESGPLRATSAVAAGTAQTLVDQLNAMPPVTVGAVQLRAGGAELNAAMQVVTARLRCVPAKPPACVAPASVKQAIAQQLGLKASDPRLAALQLKAATGCLCPP